MTVVYNYNRQVDPPAPFINITVRNEEDATLFVKTPALLDVGADRSVITQQILKSFCLVVSAQFTLKIIWA